MSQQVDKKIGVIYYRVSTTEQAEQGFSLENQKEICLNYAAKNGIEIVKLFCDEGESAKTADRAGLQELLRFCANKKNGVGFVIVYKVDRLTRNVADYASINAMLEKFGVKLLSTTEAISDSSFGKLMGNMVASWAQYDNDVRSERVKDGMRKCFQKGRMPHRVKLGYINFTTPDEKKEIRLDPERAELIKYALTEFSKGIYTQEELRVKLNKMGLRTRPNKSNKSREISFQLMHKILTSKFYFGIMESKKYGEAQGAYPPLIDETIYWKNQKLLNRRVKGDYLSEGSAKDEFPLRHFCGCGYCGRPLTAYTSTNKVGNKYPYYYCYNRKCSSRINVAKDKLEQEFVKYLNQITPKDTLLNAFKAVIIDRWQERYLELGTGERKILSEIERLKQDKQNLLNLAKKSLLPDEDIKNEFAKINQNIMDKQLEYNESRIEEFDLDRAVTYVFNFIKTIPEYWEHATYQQRVKLQNLIFPEKVYFDKEKFRTPKLSHIYELKTALEGGKHSLVALRGIEPRFSG